MCSVAWPLLNYWSYSELSEPQLCPLWQQAACPGVVSSVAYTSQTISNGAKNTQICATGYKGTACSLCSDNYYMLESRCWSCGSSESAETYFTLMVIVGACLMGVLSLAVAILRARQLATLVSLVVIAQNAVQVGKR